MFGILVCSCLTPPPPAHSSGQQALIIRPAFSPQPTCHLAIWSKELTNREMSTASAKYQFVGAAQYSRSIALLPRWAAWGHAQLKPGHAAPPCIRLQHAREPVSAPGHGGNKGLGGLGALYYEDTFCLLRGQSAFLCITCHRRRKARHLKYCRQEQSSSLSSMIDHTCSQQYGHTANPKKWVSKRSIN